MIQSKAGFASFLAGALVCALAAGGCDHVDLILNQRTFPIPAWIYQRL